MEPPTGTEHAVGAAMDILMADILTGQTGRGSSPNYIYMSARTAKRLTVLQRLDRHITDHGYTAWQLYVHRVHALRHRKHLSGTTLLRSAAADGWKTFRPSWVPTIYSRIDGGYATNYPEDTRVTSIHWTTRRFRFSIEVQWLHSRAIAALRPSWPRYHRWTSDHVWCDHSLSWRRLLLQWSWYHTPTPRKRT